MSTPRMRRVLTRGGVTPLALHQGDNRQQSLRASPSAPSALTPGKKAVDRCERSHTIEPQSNPSAPRESCGAPIANGDRLSS